MKYHREGLWEHFINLILPNDFLLFYRIMYYFLETLNIKINQRELILFEFYETRDCQILQEINTALSHDNNLKICLAVSF